MQLNNILCISSYAIIFLYWIVQIFFSSLVSGERTYEVYLLLYIVYYMAAVYTSEQYLSLAWLEFPF